MRRVKLTEIATMTISPNERAFFVQFGAQVAELRKAQGITQIQMAEVPGVSQQTINLYEVARRRVLLSALPILARLLKVSVDEPLEEQTKPTNGERDPASKLQQPIECVGQLPRSKQKFVIDMIDTVIQQAAY